MHTMIIIFLIIIILHVCACETELLSCHSLSFLCCFIKQKFLFGRERSSGEEVPWLCILEIVGRWLNYSLWWFTWSASAQS